MLGIGLSLIFAVLSWKDGVLLSILVPLLSGLFLWSKEDKSKTIFNISLVFLLVLEGFEYIKKINYDTAEMYLAFSFIPLVMGDFMKKRIVRSALKIVFWILVAVSLWKVASLKYPKTSYLVFLVVAFISLRDIFRREKDGREVRFVTDEGSVDGGSKIQKMAGGGTRSNEGLRGIGDDTKRSHRENKE
ncbi:hypothetical protein [Thermotoga sp. KOL6]|uniref:hypothetical protein n=1 Tax=Thermotoga sp. KOL6 TaxID=126741 RepID=UPI001E3936B5|nr:hypothetical protein [Thermotoga sp. KOL6]